MSYPPLSSTGLGREVHIFDRHTRRLAYVSFNAAHLPKREWGSLAAYERHLVGAQFVRHEANQSSGGHVTDTDLEDFLDIGGFGPEFSALRSLLGPTSEDPA